MAKLVLDMAAMEESFFSDTALIGIVCPLSPHRFCHELNSKLDMNFARKPESDPAIQIKKEEKKGRKNAAPELQPVTNADDKVYFHFFEYQLPLNGGRYALYKLKNGNEVLLPEVKQLDYLWMIECAGAEEEAENILHLLRNLSDIQLAQIIPAEQLKHSSHLLT
ncbi:MAG: IPExxxVDY family protein [Bacteroidetes bacterium]|nr:IPExxxVDY family protein [Bacteroidota bacterium]